MSDGLVHSSWDIISNCHVCDTIAIRELRMCGLNIPKPVRLTVILPSGKNAPRYFYQLLDICRYYGRRFVRIKSKSSAECPDCIFNKKGNCEKPGSLPPCSFTDQQYIYKEVEL